MVLKLFSIAAHIYWCTEIENLDKLSLFAIIVCMIPDGQITLYCNDSPFLSILNVYLKSYNNLKVLK